MVRKYWLEDDDLWKGQGSGARRAPNERDEITAFFHEISNPSYSTRLTNPDYLKSVNSNDPEVLVKITSTARGSSAAKSIVSYITRDEDYEHKNEIENLSVEDQYGNIISGIKADKHAVIEEWAEDFVAPERYKAQAWKVDKLKLMDRERFELSSKEERGPLSSKQSKRLKELNQQIEGNFYIKQDGSKVDLKVKCPADTYHMILSLGGQDHNHKKTDSAVRHFLQNNFGSEGRKYMFVRHDDTNNLHYHVLIKSKNEIDGSYLNPNREDLFVLRREFADECKRLGIRRKATLKKDRIDGLDSLSKKAGYLADRHSMFESKVGEGKPFDALGEKQRMLRTTEYLMKALKANTEYIKGIKKEDILKELGEFKNALMQDKPEKLKAETAATIEAFQRQAKANDKTKAKNTMRKKTHQKEFIKNQGTQITDAIKALKARAQYMSPAAKEEAKSAIKILNQLKSNTKKVKLK